MKIEYDVKFDFQDVLIKPKRSTINSRNDVDLEREFLFKRQKYIWKGIPIMTSNMDTIGTFEMYNVLSKLKMITCFHKFYNIEDYPLNLNPDYYAISSGISDNDYLKLVKIIEKINPRFVCIDIANGYIMNFTLFVKKVAENFPHLVIICGNVVSKEMVEELIINSHADIIKCGIGSGSVCTTRIQSGVGMPQLSCIFECADAAHGINGLIISDGGCVNAGDIAKAFGGGSDFVMLGSILAGHEESAGEKIIENNKVYKIFYGMSSKTAMDKHHGGVATHRSAEGKSVKILYRGNVINTINHILGGIRSTCTYIGARKIKDMSKCTTFIRVNHQVNTIYNGKEI